MPAETDNLLGRTRGAYDVAVEIENAAQQKIDEAKQRIISAEKIEYPSERENEIQNAKKMKVEGILEMEAVPLAQNSARNLFLINSYKLLFGRIKREDADFQRLEYITQ